MSVARAPLSGGFELAGLAASHLSAAVRFYADLLGWQARRVASSAVTLMRDRDMARAVVYLQTPQARAAGVAPHWSPFIAVPDVGAAQTSAVSLGAVALRPPFDAAGAGLIAPIADPVGATVSLWRPPPAGDAPRRGWENEGHCWHELATEDADRARSFYASLLGWSFRTDDEGATTITLAGGPIGAIRQSGTSEVSGWIPCFPVVDVEKSTRRAEQLGARRLEATGSQGPARLADPQSAIFALHEAADEK
jgi:predicted enzyme related to lactoylglutathione lyase